MNEHEAAGCTGKARFASYHEAQRIQKRRAFNKEYRKVEAYRCIECRGWHLGEKTPERSKQELRRFFARYQERG